MRLASVGLKNSRSLRGSRKRKNISMQLRRYEKMAERMEEDLRRLQEGLSILPCPADIEIELTEVPRMHLLSIRKRGLREEFPAEYVFCYGKLFQKLEDRKFTPAAPPMALFYDDEYHPLGLDTEFAVPVKEYGAGTRDFCPGLCLKRLSMVPTLNSRVFTQNRSSGPKKIGMKQQPPL